MRAPQRFARPGAALGGILVLSLLGALLALGSSSARADDVTPGGGGNLTVNVTDGSSPSPSESPTIGQTGTGSDSGSPEATSGSGGTGGSGSVASGGASTSGDASPGGGSGGSGAKPSGEVSVGGVLYVGGLNAAPTASVDPREGTVTFWFTVRNASKTPITATARFWMDSMLLPHEIDATADVPIAALQPGETRVATARLHHAGQWTLISAHATLTPPATVDGVALKPVTRDATVLVFPWLLALLVLLAAATCVVVLIVRSVRESRAAAAPIATDAA